MSPNDERDAASGVGVEELLDLGSEVAGGIAGAALGFLSSGPAGGLLGAAAAPALVRLFRKFGGEAKARLLSHREEVRIGGALAFAIMRIRENLDAGVPLRADGFFEHSAPDRSTAEEVLEAVLLAAQRDHEERKLKFYGNLLGNLPFHQDIDRPTGNVLIRLAQRLSYRQLQILALVVNKERYPLRATKIAGAGMAPAALGVFEEAWELYTLGLVNSSGRALLDMGAMVPAQLAVQGLGTYLYNLMRLTELEPEDMTSTLRLLM